MTRSLRGFSMLEVVAVAAVIGVLAAATLPSVYEIQRERRADLQVQDVSGYLGFLRAKARAHLYCMQADFEASATPAIKTRVLEWCQSEAPLDDAGVAVVPKTIGAVDTRLYDPSLITFVQDATVSFNSKGQLDDDVPVDILIERTGTVASGALPDPRRDLMIVYKSGKRTLVDGTTAAPTALNSGSGYTSGELAGAGTSSAPPPGGVGGGTTVSGGGGGGGGPLMAY